MPASDRLEDITRAFFTTWRVWRYEQGWRLGPDAPASLLSPFMVDNWNQLDDAGRAWFRQHAALVLAATDQVRTNRVAPLGIKESLLIAKKKLKGGDFASAEAVLQAAESVADESSGKDVELALRAVRRVRACLAPEEHARRVLIRLTRSVAK